MNIILTYKPNYREVIGVNSFNIYKYIFFFIYKSLPARR